MYFESANINQKFYTYKSNLTLRDILNKYIPMNKFIYFKIQMTGD